jgi:hypothetical protein
VKLIRATKDNFLFELSQREKLVLFHVLHLYPRIPPATFRLSKSSDLPDAEANQRLLDESLNEQREKNRRTVEAFMADPHHFSDREGGSHLSVSPPQLEWLLQILNDVRVGSWINLGSPKKRVTPELVNEKDAPDFWAMELSGLFQMFFLKALEDGKA